MRGPGHACAGLRTDAMLPSRHDLRLLAEPGDRAGRDLVHGFASRGDVGAGLPSKRCARATPPSPANCRHAVSLTLCDGDVWTGRVLDAFVWVIAGRRSDRD
jgi:hypothetical protein